MELYPEDLGETISKEVLRLRWPGLMEEPTVSRTMLAALCVVSLVATLVFWLLQWQIGGATGLIGGITGLVWLSKWLEARQKRNAKIGPVTDYEIAQLRNNVSVQDPLVRAFLKLVRTVIAVPATSGASAEQEIRSAVAALAIAIASLPPPEAVSVGPDRTALRERLEEGVDLSPSSLSADDDPTALQTEASHLRRRVPTEADPVIRASLERRAESLERRAETAARTQMLLRRNQALRDEVAEQIGVLRTNLTAFSVGGKQSAPDFAGLAARIQRVTVEANAITEARAEIDTLLAEPARTFVNDEAQEQTLRRR